MENKEIDLLELSYIPCAGEREAKAALEALGYKVTNVAFDEEYWWQDIDFLAEKDGKEVAFEVKWDKRIAETGNIFVETISNMATDRKGWLYYCRADFLLYGDAANKVFYIIPLKSLRKELKKNYKRYRVVTANDYDRKGGIYKRSQGWLVPLNDFVKKYNIKKVAA